MMILRIATIITLTILIMGCSTKSLAQKEHDKTMKEIANLKKKGDELEKKGNKIESKTTATIRMSVTNSEKK